MTASTAWIRLSALMALLTLQACGGGGASGNSMAIGADSNSNATALSVAQLLFAETALSASAQQSCATCHTDETAHADAAGTTLPLGGVNMTLAGSRSSPSLLYLATNTAFKFVDGKPFGGFTWDGRANTRFDQAAGPLLSNVEMANANEGAVADKVRRLSYFKDFARVFNLPAQASDTQVFDTLRTALQTYQQLDPDYLLFNSKYDNFLSGKATLSPQEAQGLALFNNPNKGNCASCHPSTVDNGKRPLFTNFGYAALGVPRNPDIGANHDASFFDMGLCGPTRTDLSTRTDLCGMFKIPTLRNIALTAPYFHNAKVTDLTTAVSFYATRDIKPQDWYPVVNGVVNKFNDLPQPLRTNVIQTAPFGLNPGAPPVLTRQDVDDIVAFLRTLTDDRTAPANAATIP